MLNLKKIPKRPLTVSEEPGISLSLSRVLTGEASAADIRKIVTTIPGEHPYLGYLNSKVFSDDELLERQQEVVGALFKAIRSSFGAIKSNVVKLGSSDAYFPTTLAKWTGFGETWGGFAVMMGGTYIFKKIAEKLGLKTKGISDEAGLSTKRSEMPDDATMKLKNKVWPGKGKVTPVDIDRQLMYITNFFTKLDGMANTLESVISGKGTLDAWLNPIKVGGGSDVWTIRSLHHHKGFVLYRNNGALFLETVIDSLKLPASSIIPTTSEMKDIQDSAKKLDAIVRKSEKHIRTVLERNVKKNKEGNVASTEALASDEVAATKVEKDTSAKADPKVAPKEESVTSDPSKDGAFAYNTLRILYEEAIEPARAAMVDAGNYISDSMAAILTYRADAVGEEETPDETASKTPAKPTSTTPAKKAAKSPLTDMAAASPGDK